MDSSSILTLLQNAALLLAMLFFYDMVTRHRSSETFSLRTILTGIAVGSIGVVIMLTPWHFQPGIMFDTRSVLLSISGLFLGPVPTVIAMTITAGLRAFIGGSGAVVGIIIIITSGLIGIMWRYRLHTRSITNVTAKELYLFGILVHGVMLGTMYLLPKNIADQALSSIALPVLIFFPVVTVGLGYLFIRRMKQEQSDAALLKSEERLQSVYSHAPVALWEDDWSDVKDAVLEIEQRGIDNVAEFLRNNIDEAWRIASLVKILNVNDAALKLAGAKDQAELKNSLSRFFNETTIQDFINVLAAFSNGERSHTCESPFIRLDGEQRMLEVRHAILPGHEETLDLVIITTLDITERKIAEDAMQLSSSVYQNSSEAMSVTDMAGAILTINNAFTDVTGYTREETIGKTHQLLYSGQHDQAFYQAMWADINATGKWEGEIWNKRKNGDVYAEWLRISTILNEEGIPHRHVALFTDITQQKESEEQLWQQTNFDPLTGLPNRRMFLDRLDQDTRKAYQSDMSCALILIGLDRFKDINDSLGYATGDALIQSTSERLQDCVRDSDTLARISGDEFAVILGELDDFNLIEFITQQIRSALKQPFQSLNESIYISSSIGIAFFPDDAKSADTLIQCAGHALSSAKAQGGNRRNYYTALMQESAQNKRVLVKELRHSLAAHQLSVYYQPIVNLSNGAIYKAEALLRWQHPSKGFISPADFIPIAEETGLIIEIGDWVFRQAVKQVKSWRGSIHPEFQISVNKSPVQFRKEGNSLYEWFDFLHQQELAGDSVVIEITEGLMMDSGATVSSKLFALSDAGIQVALDDFGTGYSTISYLKKFDIDYLKIDQSFVKNLENDADNVALCESMIAMAHKLGIKVIAEGVETPQQRDLLKSWGCDYAQGYLFSKPVPADEFEKLITHQGLITTGLK